MTEPGTRRAQTRLALIEAATRVFSARGIDASIEELTEAAGFTRGAFYSNFGSKSELCAAMLEHYTRSDLNALEDAMSTTRQGGAPDPVETTIDQFLTLWGGDVDVVLALHLIRIQAARDPELRAAVTAVDEAAIASVRAELAGAFERYAMSPRLPLDDLLMTMRAVYLGALVDALVSGDVDFRLVRERLVTVVKALVTTD